MPLDPDKIRQHAERRGMSLVALAAASRMTRQGISRIVSGGRTDPNLSTAERIAAALQTSVDKLLVNSSYLASRAP